MRGALLLVCLVAGCGRIGFADRSDADASAPTTDSTIDGPPAVEMWTHLTAYAESTCAVRDGKAYCWGDNSSGQLGNNLGGFAKAPQLVTLPTSQPVVDLSVGTVSACAIAADSLYCWGDLGSPGPTKITLANPAKQVSVGHDFQCVIAGDALCWGNTNDVGQLGTGDTNPQPTPTPVLHAAPAYTSIDVGDDHGCALDSAGKAWCWGHNDDGAIGLSAAIDHSLTPVAQDPAITSLPQIAGWHTCAMSSGKAKCWGEGDNGEIGDGNSTNNNIPSTVINLGAPTLVMTGGGPTDLDSSCAIAGSAVKCWGNGFYGRLGQGNANPSPTPVAVVGLPAAATELAIGYDHTCATLVDGDIYCWGRGDLGELGDGNGTSSTTPVKVMVP